MGARTILARLARLARETGTELNIEWHFNLPATPILKGLAEAGVKSVKIYLNGVVGGVIPHCVVRTKNLIL